MDKTEFLKFYREVGNKIRKARENHNKKFTQEVLAKTLGISRTSLVNIEQGRHRIQIHTLFSISKILDVSMLDLLPSITNEKEVKTPFFTKDFKPEETESIKKALSSIENKEVEINVTKDQSNRKKNYSKK